MLTLFIKTIQFLLTMNLVISIFPLVFGCLNILAHEEGTMGKEKGKESILEAVVLIVISTVGLPMLNLISRSKDVPQISPAPFAIIGGGILVLILAGFVVYFFYNKKSPLESLSERIDATMHFNFEIKKAFLNVIGKARVTLDMIEDRKECKKLEKQWFRDLKSLHESYCELRESQYNQQETIKSLNRIKEKVEMIKQTIEKEKQIKFDEISTLIELRYEER